MNSDHPDFPVVSCIVEAIEDAVGGSSRFRSDFPKLVQDAVDFVVDPIRTARTKIAEIDNVEKTFIGLKIEHFLRDYLGVPKGIRDLEIAGFDVDVKNTVRSTWMIPPETFSNQEPCVLVMVATELGCCSLGVFVARPDYLNGPNRDGKRSVSASAFKNIWWILKDETLPESRFSGLDMKRFRELRLVSGGAFRTAEFFKENLNRAFHRNVLLGLLYDQLDPMKRIRGNGGARDILAPMGIALFSGAYHSRYIEKYCTEIVSGDEFISVEIGADAALEFLDYAKKQGLRIR